MKGLIGRIFWSHPEPSVARPVEQSCFGCAYFDYCDPDDIDESDGYCSVNFVHNPNAQYGSWVSHGDWCKSWREADPGAMRDRRAERARALRKAADAVDPDAGGSTK